MIVAAQHAMIAAQRVEPAAAFRKVRPRLQQEKLSMVPVILSGGSGARLWPLSRQGYPKQFWPLVSDRTLLQDTAARASGPSLAPPIVVCNEAHRFLVSDQLRDVAGTCVLVEPQGRNSAPAAAAAALVAGEAGPDTVLWLMAADAAIQDVPALHAALEEAAAAARAGAIVTFGMEPTAPETGYGYIEIGDPLPGMSRTRRVARFLEKPDSATAQRLSTDGRHAWNSGMFVVTSGTLLEELERFAPEVLAQVRKAVAGASRDLGFIRLAPEPFLASPDISIDYAIMERTERAAVVPAKLGWSDVGSWDALWEVKRSSPRSNVTHGPVELLDCEGTLVWSEGILTGVVGLDDVVVVVTDDAVLAVPRSRAQDVKTLVQQLKARGRKEATEHRRIYRPWGYYEGLMQGVRFQVKQISVWPGQKLSLQKHYHRAEHWVVVTGTATVQRNEERIMVQENESVYLPLGCVHRLENPGKIPLTLIEVQVGSYTGEDDIIRIEDNYGRR